MNTATPPKHTNRLIHATSPYLLQHAHNPVDWFEWGPEAFAKARAADKPVFLSIGYAACHWCHVMEHECFDIEKVAAAMNDGFVCIKVDREERPDIDELYMTYTTQTTGHGGWPMSVWLTPEGVPFYAGTYFPQAQFLQLLSRIGEMWKNERDKLTGQSANVRAFFAQWAAGDEPAEGVPPLDTVDRLAEGLTRHFDVKLGGMSGGGTNKFPPSMAMELMLRAHRRTGKAELLDAVKVTLDHMARGGIYDHLGGGICRYSTDVEWLVPHFEKMLYDQALVSAIYLDAYQVTHDPLYAHIAADIFDYVIADLQSPEGGLYSTRDADSEGLEGAYYIWTVAQVKEILGEVEGRLFCAYYDVTVSGNWFERMGHAPPGPKNILHITKPPEVFAKANGMSLDDLNRRLRTWREKMLTARAKRVPPALDDKVLSGWNGLMIASLAKGANVLNQPKYAAAAARAADFVLAKMRRDGRLLRTYRNGQARLTAYLEDYAFMIEGLINLYEATFDPRWLDEAVALQETLNNFYGDEKNGAFFYTASDGEELITRSKNPRDNAVPSGNSVAAMNLLRLAALLERRDYRERAEGLFRALGRTVEESPWSFERLLCALDFYHDRVAEVAIVGERGAPATAALLAAVHARYRPNKVIALGSGTPADARVPLLKDRPLIDGKPAAYVCFQRVCKRPVSTPEELAALLDAK